MNASCIICSDLFTPKSEIFSTGCGHLFHYSCLTQWMERSKTCPQCRHKESAATIHRIYLNFASQEGISDDACTLLSKIDTVNFEISLKDKDIAKYSNKYKECKAKCTSMREKIVDLEMKSREHETAMLAMKYQLVNYQNKMVDKDKHMEEIAQLKKQLEGMEHMKKVINNCQNQVEKMLRNTSDPDSLPVLILTLKRQLEDIKKQNQSCSSQLNAIGREMMHNNSTISKLKHRKEQMQNELITHENCASEMKYLRKKIKETKSRLSSTRKANATIVSNQTLGNSTITSESADNSILNFESPSTNTSHDQSSYTPELPSASSSVTQSSDDLQNTPTRSSKFQTLTQRLKPLSLPSTSSNSSQKTNESPKKSPTNPLKRMKSSSSFTTTNKYRKLGPGHAKRN